MFRIQEIGLCIALLVVIAWFVNARDKPSPWNGPGSKIARLVQHYDSQTQSEINAIWKRIENCVSEEPKHLKGLGPPATDDEIAELEYALGFGLPGDFKASLKRHAECPGFFSIWNLLDLKRIAYNYNANSEHYDQFPVLIATEEMQDGDFWHPSLVPFAGWDADMLCLHLESGKVVSYSVDSGTSFQSASFRQWLLNVADRLESGDHTDFDICGERWPDMLSPGADRETFGGSKP